MVQEVYDVVVIGGGPIGLATAYEVAKAGKSVLVLERNNFYNQAGSSGDLMRMYRTMYTEPFMAKMAKTSLDIWAELENDAGVSLRKMTGLLNFGDETVGKGSPEGTLMDPVKNLKELEMPHTVFDRPEKFCGKGKWPFKNLPPDFKGVYAPDNGIINVPLLLRTVHGLAKDYGATTRQNVRVEKVQLSKDDKEIWEVLTIPKEDDPAREPTTYKGRKIVVTAGAYTNHILEPSFELRLNLDIWEMTANYFNINPGPDGVVFPSMWFQFAHDVKDPNFEKPRSRLFYGFPAVEWGPQNVARISVDAATNYIEDPDERRANVIHPQDIADTQQFVKDHVIGVDSTVPAFSLTCLQTNVYDNMFVLDYVPKEYLGEGPEKSVMVFTAGWAMKFVPLLGRALKDMALNGGSEFKLKDFEMTRTHEDQETHKRFSIIKTPWTDAESAPTFMSTNVATEREEGEQASGSSRPYQRVQIAVN